MLIVNKKEFGLGTVMTISFLAVLWIMFMPFFGGENAFQASDDLFNSISKSSTNHFEHVRAQIAGMDNHEVTIQAKLVGETTDAVETMLQGVDVVVTRREDGLTVSGSMATLLGRIVDDSRLMFDNKGQTLEEAYGIEPRRAMYEWWRFLESAKRNLKSQKEFRTATIMNEVTAKAVEVGYNYYGVESQPASERAGILGFALTFYVVYTLWWGYAIFHLAHGIGLVMKKGSKQEV